jgi:Protein of unknown function (DUF2934)
MSSKTLHDLASERPLESLVEHEIRIRAYELYRDRGGCEGRAVEDWLQAESEVLSKTMTCREFTNAAAASGGSLRS